MYNILTKEIPGFEKYRISLDGTVYNHYGKTIAESYFKNIRFVRLYKRGKRHTLSVDKLRRELFEESFDIPLDHGEKAFRYKDSSYFITSKCRVYNRKFNRWVEVFYKNCYPVVNVSINGSVEAVSIIKFLKSKGGVVRGY